MFTKQVSCIFFGETLTIRYDVICTVVLAADVNRQLICLLSPACRHRSPRYIYVGYGRYLFVDIVPRASADLGVTSGPPRLAWIEDRVNLYKLKNVSVRGHLLVYPLPV